MSTAMQLAAQLRRTVVQNVMLSMQVESKMLPNAAPMLEELWCGRRDPKTRKGKVFRQSYGKARPRTEGGFDGSLQRVDEGAPIPIPFPPPQQQQQRPGALREPAAAAA